MDNLVISNMQLEFNKASDSLRIVTLLSPT
jgi:hypothetical protein